MRGRSVGVRCGGASEGRIALLICCGEVKGCGRVEVQVFPGTSPINLSSKFLQRPGITGKRL